MCSSDLYETLEIASKLHNESVEMPHKAYERTLDSADAAIEGERRAGAYDTAQAQQRLINMSRQQTV